MGGLSMEWKEVRLGDLVTIRSGLAYKGSFLGKGDNILLGMGCVSFKEKFLSSGARPYDADAKEQYCVSPGDIVLATRQQSDNLPILAMPAIVPDYLEAKQIIFGTNLYKVENHSDIDNKYLFWQLKTPHYVDYISSVKTGSVVRMVTKKNVEDYVFKCPPKEIREKISSFLWSLDRKIDLNNKINAQLEEMAQAIFKNWFVDFEPFKDGKFVESELGRIPEGWRVGTLGEICSYSTKKVDINSLNKHTYYSTENMLQNKAGAEEASSLPQVEMTTGCLPYDVLISNIRPYFKKIIRVTEACGCSTDVLCFHPKESKFKSFLYRVLYDDLFFAYVMSGCKGTKMPRGDKNQIMRYPIVIPCDSVLKEFSNIVESFLEKISYLGKENKHLAHLRDTLLPKLMSGEITL